MNPALSDLSTDLWKVRASVRLVADSWDFSEMMLLACLILVSWGCRSPQQIAAQ